MIKRTNGKKKKGFTLIELIIVLAVMAIIALIAIPNFSAVRDNSKEKADKQSCETIKRTVLMLVADETITLEDSSKVGTIEVTFTNNAQKDQKLTNIKENTTDAVRNSLKEVKAPQAKNSTGTVETTDKDPTGYSITIDKDGSVEVITAAIATQD